MMDGFMESVEQPRLLRWRTVLRDQGHPGGGNFAIQMGQDSLDHRRIFNAGNDLDLNGAPLADLNIDVAPPLSRCIQVIDAWRSAGVLSSQFSPVG
jgi:hypothetical protein